MGDEEQPGAGGMEPFVLGIYLGRLVEAAKLAVTCASDLLDAYERYESDLTATSRLQLDRSIPSPERLASYNAIRPQLEVNRLRVTYRAHSFLMLTGTVSLFLWPGGGGDQAVKRARSEEIRQLLGIDDSAISNRLFRDHIAHFDERVDKWANQSTQRIWIDAPIDQCEGVDPSSFVQNLDIAHMRISIWSRNDTTEVLNLLDLIEEVAGFCGAAIKAKVENDVAMQTKYSTNAGYEPPESFIKTSIDYTLEHALQGVLTVSDRLPAIRTAVEALDRERAEAVARTER